MHEGRESRVIGQSVLTLAELWLTIAAAVEPFRVPIALAVYCDIRQAKASGLPTA